MFSKFCGILRLFLTFNIFSTRTGEPTSVYQVYQEDAPSRIDRIDMMGNLEKLADNKLFKRFDLLAPFRRRKQPKRRPNRPGKRPQVLKPVANTKKVKRKPEPEIAPTPELENPALSVQAEITNVEQPDVKVPQQNTDMERAPFISSSEFESFFPSWSRKKRHTLVNEAKIFNITSTGFGTVSYPWQDVIGTYTNFWITGGLILAVASLMSIPSKPSNPIQFNPFELNTLLPANARVNPYQLPANLPEGMINNMLNSILLSVSTIVMYIVV